MPIEVGAATSEMLVTHALNGAQGQANGAAFLAEVARQQHLRTMNLADATAAGKLLIDPLSSQVLQARAAADQPNVAK